MPQTEEGQEQWNEVVRWLNEPPVPATVRALAPARRRLPAAALDVLPKGAPLTAAEQVSAFAAFQGSTGG
jgi:hypothetical protein